MARKPIPKTMRADGLFSGEGQLIDGDLPFEAWLAKVHALRDAMPQKAPVPRPERVGMALGDTACSPFPRRPAALARSEAGSGARSTSPKTRSRAND